MVRAWYLDSSDADRRLPHMTDPVRYIHLDYLTKQCGMKYWKFDVENCEEPLKKVREEGHYDYEDEITLKKGDPDLDSKLAMFFTEHTHIDDETRFTVDGSAYFDVRDPCRDKYIRVEVEKGDMIALAAGTYHRFTLDVKEYWVGRRFFSETPVWKAFNRPQDDHPARIQYLKKYGQRM